MAFLTEHRVFKKKQQKKCQCLQSFLFILHFWSLKTWSEAWSRKRAWGNLFVSVQCGGVGALLRSLPRYAFGSLVLSLLAAFPFGAFHFDDIHQRNSDRSPKCKIVRIFLMERLQKLISPWLITSWTSDFISTLFGWRLCCPLEAKEMVNENYFYVLILPYSESPVLVWSLSGC